MVRGLLALAAIALLAGDTTRRDPRDAGPAGLDITRVTASGGDFGLIVSVDFRGKPLPRDATVAVILHPRPGAGRAAVLARRGERVLRRTRSSDVEVLVVGRTMHFYVLGGGLAGVSRIEVKAFASNPDRATAAQAKPLILDREAYDAIVGGRPADSSSVRPPSTPDAEVCRALANRIDDLREDASDVGDRSREGRRINRLRERVIRAWRLAGCRQEIIVLASGYQHSTGFSVVCADALLSPNLGERLAFTLFSGDTKVSEDAEGSVGERRLSAPVESYGRYRMQIFKQGDPALVQEIEIDVLLPPPDRSMTCS